MKNSQTKGFANIILIVLVVVLVSALGYVTLIKTSVPAEQKQPDVTESTQNTNLTQEVVIQSTSTQKEIVPKVVGATSFVVAPVADMKIYIFDGSAFDSSFTYPVHIDLFANKTLVSSIDQKNGWQVIFPKLPYGEYTARIRASGFKEEVATFVFNNKNNDGYGVSVSLSR